MIERPRRRSIGIVRTDRLIQRLGNSFTHAQCIAEIMKNSNDEYATIISELDPDQRMILIMIVSGQEHDHMIILDIGNSMTPIELERWASWGEESQDRAGEGDQGVGGKASMRQLASEQATMTTFKNNLMTTAGFYKDPESNLLGEMVEIDLNEDDAVLSISYDDAVSALNARLQLSGASLDSIWSGNDPAILESDEPRQYLLDIINERQSWTIVDIVGLEGLIPRSGTSRPSRRRHNEAVYNLIDSVQTEGQSRTTLEDSHVFFVHQMELDNGTIHNDSRLLREELPPSMDGVESREIEIEGPYEDPATGRMFTPDEPGVLTLHASQKILQGPRLLSLRGIRVHDGSNTVWIEEVPSGNEAGAAQRIFGTFTTPSSELGRLATEDRRRAPPGSISSAIRAAMMLHIESFREEVAGKLRERTESNRSTNRLQRDLDERMSRIEELVDLDSLFEDGDGPGGASNMAPEINHIFIESKSSPLTEINMASGIEYLLSIHPMGSIPNGGVGYLQELKGVRDRSPYFTTSSMDESIVDLSIIDGKFILKSGGPGSTTVKIESTDQLTGFAQAELEITVIEIQSDIRVGFDPEPGPRGVDSDILIEATSADGQIVNQSNTLFQVEVVGAGSMHSRFPPRMKTAVSDPAPGVVNVKWGKGRVTNAPFHTTEEIHIPEPREPSGNNNRKFPRLIICGNPHGISEDEANRRGLFLPGDTVPEDPGDISLIVDPWWAEAGIRWLNLASPESRAQTRNPSTGGLAGEGTDIFQKYLDAQTVEVAIQQVMDEFVRRGDFPLPIQNIGLIHELRTRAEHKLGILFEAMVTGGLRIGRAQEEE